MKTETVNDFIEKNDFRGKLINQALQKTQEESSLVNFRTPVTMSQENNQKYNQFMDDGLMSMSTATSILKGQSINSLS